jgi:hypothetical protein
MGIIQWFHFEESRLHAAAGCVPALADGRTSPEDGFAPDHEGVAPHHTSLPKDIMDFADFRARPIERHAHARPATQRRAAA